MITIGKFQFRKKTYDEDAVVKNVLNRVKKDKTKENIRKEIKEETAKLPPIDKKKANMFGKEYTKDRKKLKENTRKKVINKELNKAFQQEIGGGVHNNPHAPSRISDINETVVRNTLNKIRGVRKRTVQRNYSKRQKK